MQLWSLPGLSHRRYEKCFKNISKISSTTVVFKSQFVPNHARLPLNVLFCIYVLLPPGGSRVLTYSTRITSFCLWWQINVKEFAKIPENTEVRCKQIQRPWVSGLNYSTKETNLLNWPDWHYSHKCDHCASLKTFVLISSGYKVKISFDLHLTWFCHPSVLRGIQVFAPHFLEI